MASSTAARAPNNLATAMCEKGAANGEYCDLDFVCNYLDQHGKMTVDEGDEKGRTPLMFACLQGDAKVVEYLLNPGGRCQQGVHAGDEYSPALLM